MINEFQQHVNGFMRSSLTREQALSNWSMGLAGETGETVDLLKKHLYHDKELDLSKVEKELGDVLWYVFALASTLDLSVESIMQANINKLQKRHEGTAVNFAIAEQNKAYEDRPYADRLLHHTSVENALELPDSILGNL